MALRPEDLSEEEMLAAEARFPELAARPKSEARSSAQACQSGSRHIVTL